MEISSDPVNFHFSHFYDFYDENISTVSVCLDGKWYDGNSFLYSEVALGGWLSWVAFSLYNSMPGGWDLTLLFIIRMSGKAMMVEQRRMNIKKHNFHFENEKILYFVFFNIIMSFSFLVFPVFSHFPDVLLSFRLLITILLLWINLNIICYFHNLRFMLIKCRQ